MASLEQKFQVFISSTYEDLIEERQVVSLSVLRASCIPAGMELSSGANERTLPTLYRWIDACDIFVLLLGGRYGSVNPAEGMSYTHLEYNYARRKGIPVIALLLTDSYLNAKVREGKLDATKVFERDHPDKLKTLRSLAADENFVIPTYNFGDIEASIYRAIDDVKRNYHLNGWVRRESCLHTVVDAYSHYIDLYLTALHSPGHSTSAEVTAILRSMEKVIEAVISPAIAWVDVVVPSAIDNNDRHHLLIDGVVKDSDWLKVIYSSVPRTTAPVLIPIQVHDVYWRGSGVAYHYGHSDYVGNLTEAFPRKKYHFSPSIERKIIDKYKEWHSSHYFSSIFSVCLKDVETGVALGAINLNFRQHFALGTNDVIDPYTSMRLMSIMSPAMRVVAETLKAKNGGTRE